VKPIYFPFNHTAAIRLKTGAFESDTAEKDLRAFSNEGIQRSLGGSRLEEIEEKEGML